MSKRFKTTVNPELIIKELYVPHPIKNNHVYLAKKLPDDVILSVFSIGLGTGAGSYWFVQEEYNPFRPELIGSNSKAPESKWCTKLGNKKVLAEWAKHFVDKGYIGLCTYNEDVYQPELFKNIYEAKQEDDDEEDKSNGEGIAKDDDSS